MIFIILLSVVAIALAAPVEVQLLWSESENDGSGNYYYAFEQSDGTRQESRGVLNNEGREDEFLQVTGSYEWVRPDGVRFVVRYTADDNGYQPEIEQIQPRQPEKTRGPETPIQPGYSGQGQIFNRAYSIPGLLLASLV